MQDTKLFETILGITTPWHVARVELKTEDKRVDLWLEYEPTRWPCPECGDVLTGFDHAEARTWRHLDSCQFQTHLHAEIPRVPRAWREASARAVGRTAESFHAVDGAADYRSDSAVQHGERRVPDCERQLG